MPLLFTKTEKKNQAILVESENYGYCFLGQNGVFFLVDFVECGSAVTADVSCGTLSKLRRAMNNERRETLSSGIVLLHNNARPHTAGVEDFGWELSDELPYSSDLAASDLNSGLGENGLRDLRSRLVQFPGGELLCREKVVRSLQ